MFRPRLAVWLLIALVAAWLASCSSDVDGYHLATDESGVSTTSSGGGKREAGATGGTAGTGGQNTLRPTGGAGSGTGGGTGGGEFDARADGDSSFAASSPAALQGAASAERSPAALRTAAPAAA
jgi:hypothetical protein